MPRIRSVTLRRKLFAGFAAVGLLVAILLLIGNQFIEKSTERMEQSLRTEVQPLARLNRLESHIHQLRVLEIELPRLADFFAVNEQLAQLSRVSQAFSVELEAFINLDAASGNSVALRGAWERYRADLNAIGERAAAMDLRRVEAMSAFESALHFKRIASALEEISTDTERQARAARDAALSYQERQRREVLLISGLGLLAIAAGFFWFARSLLARVHVLHSAARRIADGESGVNIGLRGSDELTELGAAFDAMRHKVSDREQQLLAARAELETRVEARTQELKDTNRKLHAEIGERTRAEQALREAHAELEQRVQERTRALQESEQRFRDIADSASDWIWETDANLRFSYFSDRAEKLMGRSLDSLIGRSRAELMSESVSGPLPERYRAHLADLDARRPFRAFEYPVLSTDGSFRQIHVSGKPVFSGDGSFLGYRGTGTDVTELLLAQNELIGAEKLAALGGMVGGIAHEINTPIGICVTAASYLHVQTVAFERLYASGHIKRSDMETYLRAAKEASESLDSNLQRAANLIKSFKQVAVDQSSEERRRFNLREYIGEILDSLRPRLKRTSHIVAVDCPEDLEVVGYPGAYSQILTNLIMNSLIHGFEGVSMGRISISAARTDGEISLRYSDNGCGLSDAAAARVFEPFFTTRRDQGGSGLGMHITQNLVVQKLKGTITCRSAPGEGVEFSIRIPLDPDTDRTSAPVPASSCETDDRIAANRSPSGPP